MSVKPVSDPLAVYSIGLKLHTLRAAKDLSLRRLAAQVGLSTALLSKLETGSMVPTLHTLEKICRVYGIGLGHFFCEPKHHSVSITRSAPPTGRRVQRPTLLHVPTAETKLVSQIIEIPAGGSSTLGECGSVLELTAYVIEGTLQVTAAGSDEVLAQGDSIVVTTDQPLVWSADAKTPCRLLAVSARPSPVA